MAVPMVGPVPVFVSYGCGTAYISGVGTVVVAVPVAMAGVLLVFVSYYCGCVCSYGS